MRFTLDTEDGSSQAVLSLQTSRHAREDCSLPADTELPDAGAHRKIITVF